MNTVKTDISIEPFEQWICDLMISEMAAAGYHSFVEMENGFEAYIPADIFDEVRLKEIIMEFSHSCSAAYHCETIEEQNWNRIWEENYFRPLVIGDEVVVRAPFHTGYPACRYEIVIEPNMAFGTGNHETTSLMMEMMLRHDFRGKKVLDMGCGTGILAILAGKLGAADITAIDIDKWSYEATLENARINRIPRINVIQGDASLLAEEKFDAILANIQKNVIIADIPRYRAVLKNGGWLWLSGFYNTDLSAVEETALKNGLEIIDTGSKNNWAVTVFKALE